jgi:hypothetical protein
MFKFERDLYNNQITIGDTVWIDSDEVLVTSIIKVDFINDVIWFNGVLVKELN